MSGRTSDDTYERYLSDLRRSNAETEKFIAERHKLDAEALK